MSKEELKPCPFCGAPGEIMRNEYGFWPSCSSCELCQFTGYGTRKEALRLWNTRPEEEKLLAIIEGQP